MTKLLILLLLTSPWIFSQGQMYVSSINMENSEIVGKVYSIDLNCQSTYLAMGMYLDLALTPDGHLYGNTSDALYEIDTQTGEVTQIGVPGQTYITGNSMVAMDNSSILSISLTGQLQKFDLNSLITTSLGLTGFLPQGDVVWYDDALYFTASGGLLIQITLNNTLTAISGVTQLNSDSNPLPDIQGMITASLSGEPNRLIGFSLNNTYKICHLDGSFEELCTHGLGKVIGADATRLTVQTEPITVCSQLNTSEIEESWLTFRNPINHSEPLTISISPNREFPVEIVIFDIQGKEFIKQKCYSENFEMNIENLSSGLYFIKVCSQKTIDTYKLFIN